MPPPASISTARSGTKKKKRKKVASNRMDKLVEQLFNFFREHPEYEIKDPPSDEDVDEISEEAA